MIEREHVNIGYDCWCDPLVLMICSECDGDDEAKSLCWVCNGAGTVACLEPEVYDGGDNRHHETMTFTYDRPLTDDERDLMGHIRMWGSTGYPVRKVGSRHWAWQYRSLESKVVFPTKREAVASFETYMGVLRSCYAAEMYRRNVTEG